MTDKLRKKLQDEMETCGWNILAAHHQRETVFLISEQLDLIEVAIAVALDKIEDIKTWQETGDFRRPDSYEVETWEKDPDKKMAQFIIVQPFVLIQKILQQ
jgi:hypothetical protein